MGIKRKRSNCQFEDELYNIANLAGYGGSPPLDARKSLEKRGGKAISSKNAKELGTQRLSIDGKICSNRSKPRKNR